MQNRSEKSHRQTSKKSFFEQATLFCGFRRRICRIFLVTANILEIRGQFSASRILRQGAVQHEFLRKKALGRGTDDPLVPGSAVTELHLRVCEIYSYCDVPPLCDEQYTVE